MKTLQACSLLAAALLTPVLGAGADWSTDFEAAKKKAAAENKDLLIDFTGSDWCGWCIKLREEVFDHEPFQKGVADTFVLVELDFPRDKSKVPENTQKQNEELKELYGIRGYPTIYLTDAKGRPYAKTGYQSGGPEEYVKHLNELREKREARDQAMETLKKAKGEAKAKALAAMLEAVPRESLAGFYKREFNDLRKLAPESELIAAIDKAAAAQKLRDEFNTFFFKKDWDGAIKFVDEKIAKTKPEGEALQEILAYKINALMAKKEYDNALKVAEEIRKAAPESRLGKNAGPFRKRIEKIMAEEKAQAAGVGKAEQGKPAAKTEKKPAQPTPMTKKEAKPAPKKSNIVQAPAHKGLAGLNDKQLREKMEATRKNIAENARKHQTSHTDWIQAKKDAQAVGDQIAEHRKAIAELEKKAGATAKKIKELENLHTAAEKAGKTLQSALDAQEKELAKRAEIRKLEEQAAKLKAQAEALEKRAAELR